MMVAPSLPPEQARTTDPSPALPRTKPPTLDGLELLELVGWFVLWTPVFGLLTARVVDDAATHGYTPRGLLAGFAIGAGIALVLVLGTVWAWWRTGGRPAQRRALRVWRTGVLPDAPADRSLVLRTLERQERILTRSTLPPMVLAGLWVLIAGVQIVFAHDPLTPVAWVLLAGVFVGQAIVSHRRQRGRPQLETLIGRLRSEEL